MEQGRHPPPPHPTPLISTYCRESEAVHGNMHFHARERKYFRMNKQNPFHSLPTSLPLPGCIFVVVVSSTPPPPPHITPALSFTLIPPSLFFLGAEAPFPQGECFSLRLFSCTIKSVCVKQGWGNKREEERGQYMFAYCDRGVASLFFCMCVFACRPLCV